MHEYRIADGAAKPGTLASKKGSLRLDDWVLCRIYKKSKRSPRMAGSEKDESCVEEGSASVFDIHHDQKLQLPRSGSFSRLLANQNPFLKGPAVDVLDDNLIEVESSQANGYGEDPVHPVENQNNKNSNNGSHDGPAVLNTLHPTQAFNQQKLLDPLRDFQQIYQSSFK
eukprot:Gb_17882 [translate_table: standard]